MTGLHFFIIIVSVSCRRLWNATIKRVVCKVEKESCRSIIGQTLFFFFCGSTHVHIGCPDRQFEHTRCT